MKRFALFFFALTCVSELLSAQQFESGPKQVSLLELYTSEGCSSCPPADRWLSGLKSASTLWSEFVPLAFHVDYWDYIGWEDRFASREYSQRQRRYAHEFKESTVYTPGVRRNGEDWRGWRFAEAINVASAEEVGELVLSVNERGHFSASFDPLDQNLDSSVLNIAVLAQGLTTEVKRGENRGKTLTHDFVVVGLSSFASAETGRWSGVLPAPKEEATKYALAAWVSNGKKLQALQATGGYLHAGVFDRVQPSE